MEPENSAEQVGTGTAGLQAKPDVVGPPPEIQHRAVVPQAYVVPSPDSPGRGPGDVGLPLPYPFTNCTTREIYRSVASDPTSRRNVRLDYERSVMSGTGTQAEVFTAPTVPPGTPRPTAPPAGSPARIWSSPDQSGQAQPVDVRGGESIYLHYTAPTLGGIAVDIQWDVS
jgi:hypothetical protein